MLPTKTTETINNSIFCQSNGVRNVFLHNRIPIKKKRPVEIEEKIAPARGFESMLIYENNIIAKGVTKAYPIMRAQNMKGRDLSFRDIIEMVKDSITFSVIVAMRIEKYFSLKYDVITYPSITE